MTERALNEIISVITEKTSDTLESWYDIVGFLECHRIAGLFFCRAKEIGLKLPRKVEKILDTQFKLQQRKVILLRKSISELSDALIAAEAKHIFLKGSVLSNLKDHLIYADGERSSNDIDLLVKPSDLTAVSKVLDKVGYIQGEYQIDTNSIRAFSRDEIIRRRMTRGEVAPYVKLTGDEENPFVEVDINFSLGNTPTAYRELMCCMVDSREYMRGKVSLYSANKEMFFIHLIMHQYKESILYFSVSRGKDLDLYKLADIYFLWKKKLFSRNRLEEIINEFHLEKEVGAVCEQVAELFEDDEILSFSKQYGCGQPLVIDYSQKKTYCWTIGIRERILHYHGIDFLREVT